MGIHGDSLQRVYPWVWRKWISPTGYVGIKAFVLGVMSLRSGFIWSVDPIANFDIYMLAESTVMVAANIFGTFDGNISFVKVVLCIFLLPLWVVSIKQIRVTSPNDLLVALFWCFFPQGTWNIHGPHSTTINPEFLRVGDILIIFQDGEHGHFCDYKPCTWRFRTGIEKVPSGYLT